MVEPSDAELDRTIIEALSDPLTHLLRNACDHGIESPDKRLAAGKPADGTIRFRTESASGWVLIHIEDDGAGIDADRVGQIAVDRGVLTIEELSRRSDAEIRELIFAPGFSTAQAVTDVSGHGVGMDVVSSTIEGLGGAIEIESAPGRGTTFTLRLPLTIAIVSALVVHANADSFCLPQMAIEEIVPLPRQRDDLTRVKDQLALLLRGTVVPIVDLADQLDLAPTSPSARPGRVIVCRSGRHRYGIYVDAIEDVEEIVVKPLSAIVATQPCCSGASILGDGAVALVLDVAGLFSFARPDAGLAAVDLEPQASRDVGEQSQVVFRCDTHHFAVELALVEQIEHASTQRLHAVHGLMLFEMTDGTLLPALDARTLLPGEAAGLEGLEHAAVMVLSDGERRVAVVAADHVDIVEDELVLSDVCRCPFAIASTTRRGDVITVLDGGEMLQTLHGINDAPRVSGRAFVCDVSPILRKVAARALCAVGLEVVVCSDVFPDDEERGRAGAATPFALVISDLPHGTLLPPARHHIALSATHTGASMGQGERFVPRVALQQHVHAVLTGAFTGHAAHQEAP